MSVSEDNARAILPAWLAMREACRQIHEAARILADQPKLSRHIGDCGVWPDIALAKLEVSLYLALPPEGLSYGGAHYERAEDDSRSRFVREARDAPPPA